MAKRPPRRQQTSDPDAGMTTETNTEVQSDEFLDARPRQETAEVNDRSSRSPVGDPAENRPDDVTYDDIAALAYDLWSRRGHAHGSDFDDWIEAERQLRERRGRS
jgi:Protein of unknown function (DUF2934)